MRLISLRQPLNSTRWVLAGYYADPVKRHNGVSGFAVPKLAFPGAWAPYFGKSPVSALSVDAAITSRMSTRAFTSRVVPADTIRGILRTAARLSCSSQPRVWKVHVLRGESRALLSEKVCAAHDAVMADPALQDHYRAAYDYYPDKWVSPYLDRRRENGWGLYGLLGIGKADKDKMHAQHHRNYLFFDAPVGLFFTMHRAWGHSGLLRYGMFLQNIMLAAREHGLHTCPQAAWNHFGRIILPHVGAQADELLVCGMSLGYADEAALVNSYYTPRLPVRGFTRWVE